MTMGFLDTLLGEEPEVEQMQALTPEQMAVLSKLSGVLKGQVGKGIEGYGGPLVPGASPLQSKLFGMTEDWLGRQGPEAGMEYWEKAIKAPAMETWMKDVMPAIREQFIGQGMESSSGLNRALAESGQRLTTGLTGTLADVLFKAEQGLPQNIMGLMGVGGTQRGIEQEQMMEPYQKWQMEQPWANPWLQQLGLGLGTKAFENVVKPGTTGLLDTMMQAGGMIGGGYLAGKNR